jgi:hypothetical protein
MSDKPQIFEQSHTIDGDVPDGAKIGVRGDLTVTGRVGDNVAIKAEGSITLQDTGKNLRAAANGAFKARHVGENAEIWSGASAAVESLGYCSRMFGRKGVSSEGPCGDHDAQIYSDGIELIRKPASAESTGDACPVPQKTGGQGPKP